MGAQSLLTIRLFSALQLAFGLHGRDARKACQVPTMANLLSVCALVQTDGGDEELVVTMNAVMKMGGKRDRPSDGGIERLSVANNFGGVTIIPLDMESGYYSHFVYTNDISHAEYCGEVVGHEHIGSPDPYDWRTGMHKWGPYYVPDTYGQGGRDRDPCYWSSTFMIYQAEEP